MLIEELALETSRLAEVHSFYAETLGLGLIQADPVETHLQAGRSRLRFKRCEQPAIYHFAFNVTPARFADAKAWLAQRAPLLQDATGKDEFDFDFWEARAVYCRDPAGNIVELIARQELAGERSGPFGPEDLLEISEVGVPCEDLAATRKLAQESLGIEVYRNSNSANFCALGDAHGLLILVPVGREWYPNTGVAAGLAPLESCLRSAEWLGRWSGPPYRFEAVF